MAVYVDDAFIPYGRMIMCHMLADSHEELMAMSYTLGLKVRWLQKPETPAEHFDVSKRYRERAVANGAVEVSSKDIVVMIRGKRGDR